MSTAHHAVASSVMQAVMRQFGRMGPGWIAVVANGFVDDPDRHIWSRPCSFRRRA